MATAPPPKCRPKSSARMATLRAKHSAWRCLRRLDVARPRQGLIVARAAMKGMGSRRYGNKLIFSRLDEIGQRLSCASTLNKWWQDAWRRAWQLSHFSSGLAASKRRSAVSIISKSCIRHRRTSQQLRRRQWHKTCTRQAQAWRQAAISIRETSCAASRQGARISGCREHGTLGHGGRRSDKGATIIRRRR